jgi:hypothetical protein
MEADDDDGWMDGWVEQILPFLASITLGESPSAQLFLASKLASVRYLAI